MVDYEAENIKINCESAKLQIKITFKIYRKQPNKREAQRGTDMIKREIYLYRESDIKSNKSE